MSEQSKGIFQVWACVFTRRSSLLWLIQVDGLLSLAKFPWTDTTFQERTENEEMDYFTMWLFRGGNVVCLPVDFR